MDEKNKSPLIKIEGIDIKPLAEPLKKLIDSVSKGIGRLYKPTGIVREAKAQAQANLILAHAESDFKIPKPFTITPLTDVGMELATIVSCEPIPAFGKEIMEGIAKEYEMTLAISPA